MITAVVHSFTKDRDYTVCVSNSYLTPEDLSLIHILKATSSMHKAYEMLIEHYNVYIVAPAPTNDHEYMEMCIRDRSVPSVAV